MSVIILDYGRDFDADALWRLADAGCRDVLLFDYWHGHEPHPGVHAFEGLVRYARICRALGLRLRVQTPLGSPLWAPPEWYLVNAEGVRSDFLPSLARFYQGDEKKPGFEEAITLGARIPSYWNAEAENQLAEYVRCLRQAIEPEGAICISSIGCCGECLFPPVCFHDFLETPCSAWWHDAGAEQSWRQYAEQHPSHDRAGWMYGELCQITKRRLSLYSEKWLQYVPYFEEWRHLGVDNVSTVLEQNAEGLNTILFTVFKPQFEEQAAVQASRYPTWGGAEGAANVVSNSRRAHALGLRGVICGPLWSNAATSMESWMFEQLREANAFWASL